ncbi:MAG TPA: DUF3298 domain-containing protein [Acidimicrobiia bacterium]|nr:DUF3298 domain-containing protein [Acidimicrobiia bacterium]
MKPGEVHFTDPRIDRAIDSYREALLTEYLPELDSSVHEGYRSEFRYRLEPTVVNDRFIALRMTGNAYIAGGANPTQLIDSLVVSADGQAIDPLDGFLDGGAKLVGLVTAEILANPDYVQIEESIDPSIVAWIPTVEGMVAGFDEYEIAAGYLGIQEVEIPWTNLPDVLDPSGIYISAIQGYLETESLPPSP